MDLSIINNIPAVTFHSAFFLASLGAWYRYGSGNNRDEIQAKAYSVRVNISQQMVQSLYEKIIPKTQKSKLYLTPSDEIETFPSSIDSERSRQAILDFLLQETDVILNFRQIEYSKKKFFCCVERIGWLVWFSMLWNAIGLLFSGIYHYYLNNMCGILCSLFLALFFIVSFLIVFIILCYAGLEFYHYNKIQRLDRKYHEN
jgi:hypothetical protein